MYNYEILNTWIAPLLVTIIGGVIVGIVVFFITNNNSYSQRDEKRKYFFNLLNSIDNNFQKCINIHIYNHKQIDDNFIKLKEIINTIYKLSTESLPLINVGDDKYVINKIIKSATDLYSDLSEVENSFSQSPKNRNKIELLNKLRNSIFIFCHNNKTAIYTLFNNIQN